jgi:APA family basic amino acid/polyamine antiporter
MSTPTPQFFARPASGLVREMGVGSAFFYNIICATCAGPPASLLFFSWWPQSFWLGLPVFVWAQGFATGIALLYTLLFLWFATAMPRSGGEYIYTSRITSPVLGFVETWGAVWAALALVGYETFLAIQTLSGLLYVVGLSYPGSIWLDAAKWLLASPVNMFAADTVLFIPIAVLNLLPAKKYFQAMTILGAIMLFTAGPIYTAIPLMSNQQMVAANLQKYFGITKDQLVTSAKEAGAVTLYTQPTVGDWAAAVNWSLMAYIGWNFNAITMAGEIKGSISRNLLVAGILGLAEVSYYSTLFVLPFLHAMGGDMLWSWNWIFSNQPLGSPYQIKSVAAYSPVAAFLCRPDLLPWVVIGGIGVFLYPWAINSAWIIFSVRLSFAWAMDRLLPAKLAEVSPRFHSPLILTVIYTIGGYLFSAVSAFGVSPAATLWYSALLLMPLWMVPCINAVRLAHKRKDLYELAFWSDKRVKIGKYNLHLIDILAITALVPMVPVFALSFAWPIVTQYLSMPANVAVDYSLSSGIDLAVAVFAIGIIWFYAFKWYNRRKGIPVDQTFMNIPPE